DSDCDLWTRRCKKGCWGAGSRTISYGSRCKFKVTVKVVRCGLPSTFNNGNRRCTGADDSNVWGSTCTHSCDYGYELRGSSSVTCGSNGAWSSSFPTCRLADAPDLITCRVSVTDSLGNSKNSTHVGNLTNCDSQQDEAVNTVPAKVYFVIEAQLNLSVGISLPHYVNSSNVGIVAAKITLEKKSLTGYLEAVEDVPLSGTQYCQENVNSTNPVLIGSLHDCEGTIRMSNLSLNDGESFCAYMEASAGGYYNLQDKSTSPRGTETFRQVPKSKRVCFLYDPTKPVHCSQTSSGCSSSSDSILQLSTRLTRTSNISVNIQGWLDPIPNGASWSSVSGIIKYSLEVHGVDADGTTLSVQDEARKNYTLEWDSASGGPFNRTVSLPEKSAARLYAMILEVHDKAGNVAYARRLVLYDNTSTVLMNSSASLQVVSAEPRAELKWQTNISREVCVKWTGRFHNNELYTNNLLRPVEPDTGRNIFGDYDQQSGLLPVNGTDNVNGIVKFAVAWSRDGSDRTTMADIPDVYSKSTCLKEPLKDGETYTVWIQATDIMGNQAEDNVTVSIDHTAPSLSVVGLRGRFGLDGLYVHNATGLLSMQLLVHAADPHSGIKTLEWKLGTRDLSDDLGRRAVGVQRMKNVTDCQGKEHCYCPSVGVCEIHQYMFEFASLVHNNTNQGQHHRDYYITVTATNHASLQTTERIDILIDVSPPTVGVVLEGLSDDDQAEMDFTSSDVVHVRWHGFLDHESGILLYRVVLADRCLTDQEMDAANNATEVHKENTTSVLFQPESTGHIFASFMAYSKTMRPSDTAGVELSGNVASLTVPSEGRYFTSVVAYNRAMEPSGVACSDGIIYDTTPPTLVNVSITHARTGQEVACTQPDQPWLVNTNMTRVRLSRTNDCLNLCSANSTTEDVGYLPISSNHTLAAEASDEFCRTLPMMTDDSYIALPSDYLKLTWAAVDAESEMEEYHVGMGRDRTTASAPDLLPFTPTHGHHSYHARHSGLGHGAVVFIFLRALSKAGLHVQLTLGPVIIDETPPDVNRPLTAVVDGDSLSVSWTENTFTDAEQPSGVDLGVTFRVGYDHDFVTEFLSAPESSFDSCQGTGVTGCVRYPLSDLYPHDTESGRRFFFQLHVTNAAGHVTSVNTSSVRLPAHLPPSHAVIFDVINETSAAMDTFAGVLEDVDVIVQREEVCMAWHGLYHEDEVTIEVGIGSISTQDDLLSFRAVQNIGHACVDATSLPIYAKLFSVVRATSPGGSTVFSSDGFHVVPPDDSTNGLHVFHGIGCTAADVVGSKVVTSGTTNIHLTAMVNASLHSGDILFVKFTPFIEDVVFPDAVLLQTTFTGYQVVLKSFNATVVLPASRTTSAVVEVMSCLKDAAILPMPEGHVTVTWELAGPWTNLVKRFKVELTDEACLRASRMEDEYDRLHCLLDETRVGSITREVRLRPDGITEGHDYTATVAPCLDDSCLSASKSSSVTYSNTGRSVVFRNTTILAQSSRNMEVKINAVIVPTTASFEGRPCEFRWMVARDQYGTIPITDHHVGTSASCSTIEVQEVVDYTGSGQGSLYVCLRPVFPWRADNPTCHRLVRPGNINHVDPFHVIELPHTTLRQTDFGEYLHSHQLGGKLHELYDLDLDFARSDVMLSAVVTYSEGRNITWFLMTNPHVPTDGSCEGDAECVTSLPDKKETVMFPRSDSKLQDGHVYFICARLSLTSSNGDVPFTDVCGDGVVIDDSPPEGGTVIIGNANNGYVVDNVVVTWSGFSDVETRVSYLPDEVTLNYSVALGSYSGGEDLAGFVSVGQRTAWTFQHLSFATGVTCFATVKAENRLGHVTEVWSESVVVDNTPPTVGHVTAGETTRENFVAGPKLQIQWEGVADNESGIQLVEVAVATEGGRDDVIPFQYFHDNTAELADTSRLVDGHSYVVLLKAINGAGLTTLTSSEPFIMDSSPPGPGRVWNSALNTSDHGTYSSDVGVYRVYWAGFSDPHSGLDYYRVGLGSQPGHTDIHPFVYVGLQTSYIWRREFEQGRKYHVTVEACNKAGLCRVTSSSSTTFDDSPPVAGHVTVGFDGRHSKYLGHNSSVPVQWTGFSDPQTGIQEFWLCVGTTPEGCDVIPVTQTLLSRATVRAGLSLPVATPLYVTVRARNPAGLDTISVSDSFIVDPTPPEVAVIPHFLSPRDGSAVDSQWDRSVLRMAWRFVDPDSSVVSHTINIRSKVTGRVVVEPIRIGADTELTLTLDKDHLLLDGDSHWAAVTACNAAGLCTTSISDLLLVDSTPPVVGTFLSPLAWTTSPDSSGTRVLLDAAWHRFADAESGISAYYIMAGRQYNGDELSNGQVMILHDNTTQTQRDTFPLSEDLEPGDVVYLMIWAENSLGLHSPILRMAFEALKDDANGTSGSLERIRHSCEAFYCTGECTCVPSKLKCKRSTSNCQEYDNEHPRLGGFRVSPYIGLPTGPKTFTTSAKCLEGHWDLSDPKFMSNVSRFEWSFSLANKSEGEGIFNRQDEAVWYDVGRNTSAVHCMPGKRVLKSGQGYILHVRTWLSSHEHVTFVSSPVMVDHTLPQIRRGRAVIDSDVTCTMDVDYVTTEPTVTACWDGVFRDAGSQITQYEVWFGTSVNADDHVQKMDVGLNTSWSFPTSGLERGTRYYVTVRAVNGAGLMTTAFSDGVTVDVTPPVTGVVFAADRYTHRPAQTSTTTLPASWHGFQDAHSGVTSYYVTLNDVTANSTSLMPFRRVGTKTEYTLSGLTLEHNHRYTVVVKARDKAGLESDPVESRPILIDVTAPEGVTCGSYQLQEERNLSYFRTSSILHDSYSTDFSGYLPESSKLIKIELVASDMEPGATGYVTTEEMKMPIYFKYAQSGVATAEHVFMSASDENSPLNVEVHAKPGSQITAKLYLCNDTTISEEDAVTIHQMGEFAVSVFARIRDNESGIRFMMVGVGTTPGGLQVQTLTPVGHGGHALVNVQLQHGLPVYATVHVENYAGQWSRFISQPVTMDRTPPEVTDIILSLRYEGEGQDTEATVWAEATWRAKDEESGVVSCSCSLEGHSSRQPAVQKTNDLTPGFCQWQLYQPRHEASVRVTVSCVNGVQIHATATSAPAVILLRPPDLGQVSVTSLSNLELQSPYHKSDLGVRSSNSSLEFCWHGLHDPTVTEVEYSFLHESRPLTEWSPVHTYKTSVVWGQNGKRLSTGDVTAQVRATNSRNMTSDTVSTTVRLDDRKPSLTGRSATATLRNGELLLNWTGVFSLNDDVIFAVYAGTAEGYGDLINHVVTKATAFRAPFTKTLPSMFLTVQAVYVNGHFEVYSAEMRL
ncbi:hypothetical protein BaRGS_00011987, partial [Batillaria attramentaria]